MENNILCRLCAEQRDSFVRIYEEEGQKLNLATKIIQCLQIWLYPEDPLPKTVCIDCCAKLNQYFDFFETTSRAQLSLQIMFDPKVSNKTVKKELGINAANSRRNSHQEAAPTVEDEEGIASCGSSEADEGEAEPPEFVECVLSEKDNILQDRMETTNFSRRKCRYPVKRAAGSAARSKGAIKEQQTSKERTSAKGRICTRATPLNQAAESDVMEPQESMPLQERLLIQERANNMKAKQEVKQETETGLCQTPNPTDVCGVDGKHQEICKGTEGTEIKGTDGLICNDAANSGTSKNEKKVKSARKKRDSKPSEKPPRPKAVLEGYPWQCTDCPSVLGSLQELRLHHQDVHQQPPTFKCVQCAKTYTRYRSFARHVKLHRNPKKFKCEECGKCFSQKTVLQSHRTVHTDARPHVCPQCGKAFKQFSSLYLHSKCHLPDQVKPKFPYPHGRAQLHLRRVRQELHRQGQPRLPHPHALRGEAAPLRRLRQRVHRRQHTGERPYSCAECRREFTNWANYNKHMKRRHRNPDDPNAANNNRVTSTRNYQPPSGIPAGAENSLRTVPPPQTVNSMSAAVASVSPMGNAYSLNPHSAICENSNNNSNSSMSHITMSPPVVPMANASTGIYSAQNHVPKMATIYGPHPTSGGMNPGVPSKMHSPSSLSSVFHSSSSIVGGFGNNGHKVPTIGNVFHGNHQPDTQDSVERNMERTQPNNPLMVSYHVPSYVSTSLPMGSMGYYIPPIHHTEPSIDMLHNRMGNGQLPGNS
ncbi:Transcription factor grauzone [Gryllus bimaculatus]|nr:Transcription factor grauzone [Gryllus bimaculatus]